MDTIELQHILDHNRWLSPLHAQVCAKDQLPTVKPPHVKAYIVNTHRADQPGEHWVLLYFITEKTAIYFDSYGRLPFLECEEFMNNHCRQWIHNKIQLQGLSSVCGLYCLYVLTKLVQGRSLHNAVTRNDRHNITDHYVFHWFLKNHEIFNLYIEARHMSKDKYQCCGTQCDRQIVTNAIHRNHMYYRDLYMSDLMMSNSF
jgi:hypothetical protein